MIYDGSEQLCAIAGLCREQDGISMTRVLIDSLRAIVPDAEVSVLEVYGHRAMAARTPCDSAVDGICVRRFDENGHRVKTQEQVPDIDQVLQTLRPVASDDEAVGAGRLSVPLIGDIGPLRLVVLDGVPMDPWVRTKVLQVIEVYGNLIKLLDSRERDPLTGLLNRQTFATLFEYARDRMLVSGQGMALAVLDIDHFKKVNDTFGHLYGDEVLIHFARLMERSFRYTDDLFRYGGEEFVVLLADVDRDKAMAALERFRKVVEKYAFPGVGKVTVSIGYVNCEGSTLPTTLIDRADQALYFAKDNGRNQVAAFADFDDDNVDESGAVQLF